MKYTFVNLQRLASMYAVAVWLVVLSTNSALAQVVVDPTTLQATMSVTPGSLYQELRVGERATQTFTIANTGASNLEYNFASTTNLLYDEEGPLPPLYGTSFEEFASGGINGKNGWRSTGNCNVTNVNPFEGANHLRCVSSTSSTSRATAPSVFIAGGMMSSLLVRLAVEPGVTWDIAPGSSSPPGAPNTSWTVTTIRIAPDGAISASIPDPEERFSVIFVPTGVTAPQGYFDLRVEVNHYNFRYTLYINGDSLFTAQAGFYPGSYPSIGQVNFSSGREMAGRVMDIDYVALFDGPPFGPWLTYGPKAGIVPPGQSAAIRVSFNASDKEEGYYADTLRITSNDPAHTHMNIPVVLNISNNAPPELAAIAPLTVGELDTASITFTATDLDNEPITVVLDEDLDFITMLDTANGQATYSIKPLPGDEGTYNLNVTATDARGKSDTKVFQLVVTPYGVVSFTLFNTRTNLPMTTFTDTVEIDLTHPDFSKLAFVADTDPASVGSVRFWIDGYGSNTDNAAPYVLNTLSTYALLLLGGDHILTAKAYMQTNGGGTEGKSLSAVIRIINPAQVTDLDVVKLNGSKVADLVDGFVVDLSQTAYKKINIKANAAGGKVRSVVFSLNGVAYRTDNLAPYQLGGVGSLIDLPWPAVPGSYQLTATPYSEIYGLGIAGQPLTVSFTVINGVASASTRSRGPEEGEELKISEESPDSFLNIYPVPVRDELHIELHEKTPMHVGVFIHNAQGVEVFTDGGGSDKFRSYSVSTGKLGMRPGVYFLQVRYEDGRRAVKKILKE